MLEEQLRIRSGADPLGRVTAELNALPELSMLPPSEAFSAVGNAAADRICGVVPHAAGIGVDQGADQGYEVSQMPAAPCTALPQEGCSSSLQVLPADTGPGVAAVPTGNPQQLQQQMQQLPRVQEEAFSSPSHRRVESSPRGKMGYTSKPCWPAVAPSWIQQSPQSQRNASGYQQVQVQVHRSQASAALPGGTRPGNEQPPSAALTPFGVPALDQSALFRQTPSPGSAAQGSAVAAALNQTKAPSPISQTHHQTARQTPPPGSITTSSYQPNRQTPPGHPSRQTPPPGTTIGATVSSRKTPSPQSTAPARNMPSPHAQQS